MIIADSWLTRFISFPWWPICPSLLPTITKRQNQIHETHIQATAKIILSSPV